MPEVFAGLTSVINEAPNALLNGTYAPKQTARQIRNQLKLLDPTLEDEDAIA